MYYRCLILRVIFRINNVKKTNTEQKQKRTMLPSVLRNTRRVE